MKQIALLAQFMIVLGLVVATPAYADPPRSPATTCHGGGLTAPPQFGRVPPGVAEYSFSGVCVTRTQDLGYQATGKWTPSEPNPVNANASEVYRIGTVSGPSRSFDVILGARCDSDPWLNEHATCTRVGDNLSDELRELWPELADSLFPYSRKAIPFDEQDALRAEYARVNAEIRVPSTAEYATDGIDQRAARVGLNPQPLPPRADSATQAAPQTAGTNAGIIIVSGKDANPLARKAHLDALAARGPGIANEDPAAVELRNQQPDGMALRGFDIGMAAAEGHTLPGPGKDTIGKSLHPDEQAGFNAAVAFSLARNRQKITDPARKETEVQSESFDALNDSNRMQPDNSIGVQVRYPVAYGYQDTAGLFDSSPNSCGAFRIDLVGLAYVPDRALTGIHIQPHMRMTSGMYVCDYEVRDLPIGEPVTLRVAMANQGAAASEAWLGGSDQPSGGQRRAIVNGDRQVTLTNDSPRASEVFDMVYAGEAPDPVRAKGGPRWPHPANPPRPICDNARQARARNSPAAPGLEAKCLAAGAAGETPPVKAQGRVKLDPTGTAPNPPRAICDLARQARARNSPAAPGLAEKCRVDLAAKGAAIAQMDESDESLLAARTAEAGEPYRQGFDIATAIFGNPALGAQGNTATGPGSLGIRDSLTTEAGQRGFNASVKLHLSRDYSR